MSALSARQERRLRDFLEEKFMELTRGYKKRMEPSTHLPTLPSYLHAAQQILSLILQIPPIDPSTSLRTAYLLRLTGEVLGCIPGYTPEPTQLNELLDWLDDLDQAWMVVLEAQTWDPQEKLGRDLVVDVDGVANGLKSTPVSQTERTRLRSLLISGIAALEEWLEDLGGGEEGIEELMGRLGLNENLDELFSKTLHALGRPPDEHDVNME